MCLFTVNDASVLRFSEYVHLHGVTRDAEFACDDRRRLRIISDNKAPEIRSESLPNTNYSVTVESTVDTIATNAVVTMHSSSPTQASYSLGPDFRPQPVIVVDIVRDFPHSFSKQKAGTLQ